MSFEPCIICFKHCNQRVIFCKRVPDICPLCYNSTILSGYILDPFRLPNPFSKAEECPVTIVLRPSNGDFLNHYKVTDDLHIGIVNSRGCIHEFDKPGLIKNDFSNWRNCLALKIVPESWVDHWDETVESLCRDEKWSRINYDEDSLNCFNFILEFFKLLKYKDLEFSKKEEFCSKFIIPRIRDALKFIAFYRKLKDVDYFFSD